MKREAEGLEFGTDRISNPVAMASNLVATCS